MLSLPNMIETYEAFKEQQLYGRYIHYDMIAEILEKNDAFQLGLSHNQIPIKAIDIGQGDVKILIWSQMHGNESTGTKAVFDFLNFINTHKESELVKLMLQNCRIRLIPMLNPDGALAYTRVNAQGIDLNRDAVHLQAPESRILRSQLASFDPCYCFNLHDQRTIFGVDGSATPATLSFLAPSTEESRTITHGRKKTMAVIAAIFQSLDQVLPNGIGRYTDEFYPNATGDNFQKEGYHTVLVESGHYPNDYEREITRKFTFLSLVTGIHFIASQKNQESYEAYFNIPNNVECFFDVIHRYDNGPDIAYQYEEGIKNGTFSLSLQKVPNLDASQHFAHKEIVFVN